MWWLSLWKDMYLCKGKEFSLCCSWLLFRATLERREMLKISLLFVVWTSFFISYTPDLEGLVQGFLFVLLNSSYSWLQPPEEKLLFYSYSRLRIDYAIFSERGVTLHQWLTIPSSFTVILASGLKIFLI